VISQKKCKSAHFRKKGLNQKDRKDDDDNDDETRTLIHQYYQSTLKN